MLVKIFISFLSILPLDSGCVFKYLSSQDTIVIRNSDIIRIDERDDLNERWDYCLTDKAVKQLSNIHDKTGNLYLYKNYNWILLRKHPYYAQVFPEGYYYYVYSDAIFLKGNCISIYCNLKSKKEKRRLKKLRLYEYGLQCKLQQIQLRSDDSSWAILPDNHGNVFMCVSPTDTVYISEKEIERMDSVYHKRSYRLTVEAAEQLMFAMNGDDRFYLHNKNGWHQMTTVDIADCMDSQGFCYYTKNGSVLIGDNVILIGVYKIDREDRRVERKIAHVYNKNLNKRYRILLRDKKFKDKVKSGVESKDKFISHCKCHDFSLSLPSL